MAYGLIYNLNFSSNLEGNRAHRISIYKDGHTSTITTSDNNIIGTDEPAVLIWDNTDDIYKSLDRVHYFLIAGYVFDLSETIKFKPSMINKYDMR